MKCFDPLNEAIVCIDFKTRKFRRNVTNLVARGSQFICTIESTSLFIVLNNGHRIALCHLIMHHFWIFQFFITMNFMIMSATVPATIGPKKLHLSCMTKIDHFKNIESICWIAHDTGHTENIEISIISPTVNRYDLQFYGLPCDEPVFN